MQPVKKIHIFGLEIWWCWVIITGWILFRGKETDLTLLLEIGYLYFLVAKA